RRDRDDASARRGAMTRLVIADDHAAMRWLVKSLVGSRFDEVIETANGRELFWQLVQWSYEPDPVPLVVIADICMPVYNGLDVPEACKELGIEMPTIAITSYPTPEIEARAAELGVTLVSKPFTGAELSRAVARASGAT